MDKNSSNKGLSRRDFLKLGSLGFLALSGGRALPALARQPGLARLVPGRTPLRAAQQAGTFTLRLVATDGHILLPGRDPLYMFGFRAADPVASIEAVTNEFKGMVQSPSPIIGVDQEDDVYLTLTNIGLTFRPDLDDSHTVHWHGFRNPVALFDGVPEVSIAVPVSRDFPYFFKPHDPGTYIYHCHFEDTEHVQMGMTGVVFVRPAQNQTGAPGAPVARLAGNSGVGVPMGYVYNDGVSVVSTTSTAYDREFTLLLNEIDNNPHDGLEAVQEFIWSNYKPNYWVINGRAWPDTIRPNNDPYFEYSPGGLNRQPISSLIQVNSNDRVLLRIANLGYEQHTMQLAGIPMRVIGHDATLLRYPTTDPSGANLMYTTNHIYIGPGECRDVIFQKTFDPSAPALTDSVGAYNRYLFLNRNLHRLTNNGTVDGATGLGGMATEVRVYSGSPLPDQLEPNETYS